MAKFFQQKFKLVTHRKGERFKSTLMNKVLDQKLYHLKGKIDLKNYIHNFLKTL